MAATLKEKSARIRPSRRERFEAETERPHEDYLTLRQLWRAKALTQMQVAETLGVGQATVAKMEKRGDPMISTLRGYVEAMGGRLELTVEFPGRATVRLEGLGETEETSPARDRVRYFGARSTVGDCPPDGHGKPENAI